MPFTQNSKCIVPLEFSHAVASGESLKDQSSIVQICRLLAVQLDSSFIFIVM